MDFLIKDCILCPITPHDVLAHEGHALYRKKNKRFTKKDEKKNDFFLV